LATQAERSERKARFGGHAYTPPSADGWRALLSSADPNGSQSVWLLRAPQQSEHSGVLLGFVHNELLGLTHFFGAETLDKTLLPQPTPLGQPVTVTMDNGHKAAMLEVPFDFGRWLLLQALTARHTLDPKEDRPDEYKLYNDLIWQFAAPAPNDADWPRWQYAETPAPPPTLSTDEREALVDRLFRHPVMEHWQFNNWTVWPDMAQVALPQQELMRALLKQMEQGSDSQQLNSALSAGLRAQAGWLYLAGERALAQQCATLAAALPTLPVSQNPVLARMLASALLRRDGDKS
jgi:hypothetical protein